VGPKASHSSPLRKQKPGVSTRVKETVEPTEASGKEKRNEDARRQSNGMQKKGNAPYLRVIIGGVQGQRKK